jgi:Lysylphosphatidylglycerol synthase TM region
LIARHFLVTRARDAPILVGSSTANQRARFVWTVAGFGVAVYFVGRLLAHADVVSTWQAIGRHRLALVLSPAPIAFGMALDAYGTLLLLRALGSRTTFAQMLPVRIAAEALHVGVPAGFVAADTATAVLLEARSDVPVRDGVVASIARRWLSMRAHAAYIALGVLVGFPGLTMLARSSLGGWLPWVVLASASLPLGASCVVGGGLLGRTTFATLHRALMRLPFRRLRRWLETRQREAVATDAQVARLRAAQPAITAANFAFFGCWCIEALESAFLLGLLGLLGSGLGLRTVLAIEGAVSVVRSLAVITASGLGVVDLGYAAALSALGVDPGSAAAFMLLKRFKEVAWAMAGCALLGGMRGRVPSGSLAAPT